VASGSSSPSSSSSSCPRDVQVCTVDAFQGAEKDIVIVASTRTERLGFIVSPQRMCVALTRARHHLIVLGDKRVLTTNPLWREVVNTSKVVTDAAQIFRGGVGSDGEGRGGVGDDGVARKQELKVMEGGGGGGGR
ncbi:unnamed protein product, partial [Scytosiphon promiscuus]